MYKTVNILSGLKPLPAAVAVDVAAAAVAAVFSAVALDVQSEKAFLSTVPVTVAV